MDSINYKNDFGRSTKGKHVENIVLWRSSLGHLCDNSFFKNHISKKMLLFWCKNVYAIAQNCTCGLIREAFLKKWLHCVIFYGLLWKLPIGHSIGCWVSVCWSVSVRGQCPSSVVFVAHIWRGLRRKALPCSAYQAPSSRECIDSALCTSKGSKQSRRRQHTQQPRTVFLFKSSHYSWRLWKIPQPTWALLAFSKASVIYSFGDVEPFLKSYW